jgi:hypothetical protein
MGTHRISLGKPEKKRQLRRCREHNKKYISEKRNEVMLTGFNWLWLKTSGGLL